MMPVSMAPSLMTPSRSNTRSVPNSTNYAPTIIPGGFQQKLNVVTRVAIEGKAKKSQDGASVRMFLKLCIPVDLVTPGSTVALFQEENIKVLKSQVHPLDESAAPYNFSSTVSPLLHSAAHALNLPPRLPHTFDSTLKQTRANGHGTPFRTSRSEPNDLVPPVDIHYTGQVSVSGYNIAFVLPKEFPTRLGGDDEPHMQTPCSISRSRSEDDESAKTPFSKSRLSIGEKNQAQFMAAIEMWVPLLSKPPRSPFLLSIPTPRCLHNHIKLRIFPPHTTSTSFASLSSMEEDSNAWDLTSDPHVTRITSRPSRSGSYTHFADDESSDAAASAVYSTCVIQGTFPSAQRIRVRWARPPRNVNLPGEVNALRRVGVEGVKSEMVCTVRGKGLHPLKPEIEGVLMDVEYKGECKGIWFPGVATMLGLDVSIVSRNCDIWWAPSHTPQWAVSGSSGYTGFDNRTPRSQLASLESNGALPEPMGPDLYDVARTRTHSASDASLLRAPLPSHNVEDYSFESSNATLPSGASSIASIPISSESDKPPQPCSTIAIHINMNDLQPLSKNIFTFGISGTIVVTPKASPRSMGGEHGKVHSFEPVTLPRFTVLAADSESTSLNVRNEVDGASVEVFKPYGDVYKDPQTRKTVLQKSGATRCGEEGGRIALKCFDILQSNEFAHSTGRPRTPSSNVLHRSNRNGLSSRAKGEGPPILTTVYAFVTAFTPSDDQFPDTYAVRLSLKTPAISDSEWLEFGISTNSGIGQSSTIKPCLQVDLVCASIDGIPVKAELTKASTALGSGETFGIPNGQQWLSWGKIHAAGSVGGNMVVDYIVKEEPTAMCKGKQKMPHFSEINILLPTFFVPVARFEAKIDAMPGFCVSAVHSEFHYVRACSEGHRLVLFSIKEHTHPRISLLIKKNSATSNNTFAKWYHIVTWTGLLAAFALLYRLSGETERLRKITDSYSVNTWPDKPTAATTTSTDTASDIHSLFTSTDSESSSFVVASVIRPVTTTTDVSSKPTETMTTPHYPHKSSYANHLVEGLARRTSYSLLESYGLLPVANIFAFNWTNRQAAFGHALEKLTHSAQIFWNICRRLYHYPLDPP